MKNSCPKYWGNYSTGIIFIDFTPLRVCSNRRIHQIKTFKDITHRGQCSIGWFYDFKLHIICIDRGYLVDMIITPGKGNDRKPLTQTIID